MHRIFVVEDNPGDLFLIKEALRHKGIAFEITHHAMADSAIAALEKLDATGGALPNLILLDYNVPRGHGRDILSAAIKNPALEGVPKAILTSSQAPKDRQEALQLGAHSFIVKPANLDAFYNEVGGAIASLLDGQWAAG